MRDCYALHLKICAYLNPDDFLRDELARFRIDLEESQERSHACRPAKKNSQRKSPSVLELRSGWKVLENQLRVVMKITPQGRCLSACAPARRRSSAVAQCSMRALPELSGGAKNDVIAAEEQRGRGHHHCGGANLS